MIRQRIFLLALLVAACQFGGCVAVRTGSGGSVAYVGVPIPWFGSSTGLDGERSNRAGTTYFNERWASDPDSHPAVSGALRAPQPQPGPAEGKNAENGSRSASPAGGSSGPAEGAGDARAPMPAAPYPPYSHRTAREAAADGQATGAVVGALIGAQAAGGANARLAGIVVGSGVGALAGGKLADPCQPDANAGSLWGGLAGAWLGSLFGGGRARDVFIALGASGGALRGTELWGEGRRCR